MGVKASVRGVPDETRHEKGQGAAPADGRCVSSGLDPFQK